MPRRVAGVLNVARCIVHGIGRFEVRCMLPTAASQAMIMKTATMAARSSFDIADEFQSGIEPLHMGVLLVELLAS